MQILKDKIEYNSSIKTDALIFIPDENQKKEPLIAIFTHGYTSEKSSILNWGIRLAEIGVTVVIFDLPGHYLANFSDVDSFEEFKNSAHLMFIRGLSLVEHLHDNPYVIFGGHSLGALLAIKAIAEFANPKSEALCIGLGMAPVNVVHLFDTPFYKETLLVRTQLVSPALHPDLVFPWIKDEKLQLAIQGAKIHLISGADDMVVGANGAQRLMLKLIENNNRVTMDEPSKLPHHEPNMAALYIKKYVRQLLPQLLTAIRE